MQLCEDCGANPAIVHLTRIVNETTMVSHLCEECSQKKGLITGSSISITREGQEHESGPEKDAVCPRCQLSFSEFKTKGRLGCCDCYRHFEKDIDSLLLQVHGSTTHKGKACRRSGHDNLDAQDIERLKSKLTEAIEKEEFELAALIRDTIHSFDAQNTRETLDQAR
ncbi:MAG: UvrB/UvrC motif-containing protein [Chitinivibrionales bacterium]